MAHLWSEVLQSDGKAQGCAHRAKICDRVDGVDRAPLLKRGQMGRIENDGIQVR
jgi:hypothetical protein